MLPIKGRVFLVPKLELGNEAKLRVVREIDLSPRCELRRGPVAATIDRDSFRSFLLREHPQ
jgi:hypothetical protein